MNTLNYSVLIKMLILWFWFVFDEIETFDGSVCLPARTTILEVLALLNYQPISGKKQFMLIYCHILETPYYLIINIKDKTLMASLLIFNHVFIHRILKKIISSLPTEKASTPVSVTFPCYYKYLTHSTDS